jgi:DNA-binding transcriptional MerR regulator
MKFRVEDLAARSGLRVDTIRFYQGRGLLPPPRREGRVAWYDESHLARLRRIRGLLEDGLSLALVRRVLEAEARPARGSKRASAALAAALAAERVGERTFTRAELAAESGVPEALIVAAQSAGLVEPIRVGGAERFAEADLRMARAGLALLSAGFPLHELLDLAVRHARATQETAERAIELFDRHVRRKGGDGPDAAAITAAFRELLPEATRLVALHFQRTVVNRALRRLEDGAEGDALREAVVATESSRLEVAWRR